MTTTELMQCFIIKCVKCGGDTEQVIIGSGVHYGKYICKVCGKFVKWMPKPVAEKLKGEDGKFKCCAQYDGMHETVLQTSGKHYAKLICTHCKHFKKWVNDPKVSASVDARNESIKKFLEKNRDKLTGKNIDFLENIQNKRWPTALQTLKLNSLLENKEYA